MQELEVIHVDPYTVERFQDMEFVHHYRWKEKLYKAGDFYMSVEEVDPEEEPELHEMWSDLNYYLNYEMEEVVEASSKLEEETETFRLQMRPKSEKMLKQIKSDPKNPSAYYLMVRAKAMELRYKAKASVLVARAQYADFLKPAIVMLLQAKLRTNMPLYLVELQDSTGARASAVFVWTLPQRDDGKGNLSDAEDIVNPDTLRDFRAQLLRMLPPEEFKELCRRHGRDENLVKVFTEEDEKRVTGEKKLIIPG